jgi:integrase
MKLPDNIDRHNGGYRLRYTVNGERKYKRLNPKKDKNNPPNMTARQITAWLEAEKARVLEKATGNHTKPRPFGDVLDMYLDDPAVKIRDTTRTVYRGQAQRIKNAIGHILINELTSLTIQRYIDTLSAGTMENNKGIISSVCKYAKKLRMIDYNPTEDVELPEETPIEREIYSRDEVGAILTALADYSNPRIGSYAVAQLRLFVTWALHSGMRTGELLGLMWQDIDFINKKVKIHQQLIYENKRLYIYPKTKNKKPRTINIPSRIIDLLTEYRELQKQKRARHGWSDNGMVFADYKTGELIPKTAPRDWFNGFCKKHNFTALSPHSFRHFFATVLYKETKDAALVAKVIGDEISTVIKYYVHAEDGAEETACSTIENVIGKELNPAKIQPIGVKMGYISKLKPRKSAV